MPRPKEGYKLANGTKVPGVGDVVGRFKNSGALINWAYRQGKDGVPLYSRRDWAADVGTAVHDMIDCDLNGDQAGVTARAAKLDSEGQAKAMMAFTAWRSFAKNHKIKVIADEISLVSETHRYGGTLDKVISIDGSAPAIIDFKTGKGVYPDQVLQVAAYKGLWDENRPDVPLTGGFHILHCNRETGEFGHRYFGSLDDYLEQFLLLRRAFDADQILSGEHALTGETFGAAPAMTTIAVPVIEATANVVAPASPIESETAWLAARADAFAAVRDRAAFQREEAVMLAAKGQVSQPIFLAAATLAVAADERLKAELLTRPLRGDFTRIEVKEDPQHAGPVEIITALPADVLAKIRAGAAKLTVVDAG